MGAEREEKAMDQIRTGKFIAEVRKEKGLTQREVAQALGISDKTVSKWETGKGLPEVGLMLPLCGLLEITVNELLSGQRLTAENYKTKAEETIMELMNEKQENRKRRRRIWVILLATMVIGFGITLVAVHFEMPLAARWLLFLAALAVFMLGESYACSIDRVTGYFQCRHCGELFVPDEENYRKNAWSILPGYGRLKCPECGKAGLCKRKLER